MISIRSKIPAAIREIEPVSQTAGASTPARAAISATRRSTCLCCASVASRFLLLTKKSVGREAKPRWRRMLGGSWMTRASAATRTKPHFDSRNSPTTTPVPEYLTRNMSSAADALVRGTRVGLGIGLACSRHQAPLLDPTLSLGNQVVREARELL